MRYLYKQGRNPNGMDETIPFMDEWRFREKLSKIPSGKRLHYGKSPCLLGTLTSAMAIFNRCVNVSQRVRGYTIVLFGTMISPL